MKAVLDKVGDVQTIAVLNYSDNAAYVADGKIWTDTAKAMGIKVVNASFPADTVNFSPIVSKLRGQDVDVIFLGALPVTDGPLIKQIRNAGIDAQIAGDSSLLDPSTLSVSGGASAGAMSYTAFLPTDTSPQTKEFVEGYRKMFGQEPNAYAAYAYDATNLVVAAVKKAGSATDRQAIRDALASTKEFPGVTGKISYPTKGGDALRASVNLVALDAAGKVVKLGEVLDSGS
jgi:branched-chain amino acid transport system substrate-binding protein